MLVSRLSLTFFLGNFPSIRWHELEVVVIYCTASCFSDGAVCTYRNGCKTYGGYGWDTNICCSAAERNTEAKFRRKVILLLSHL